MSTEMPIGPSRDSLVSQLGPSIESRVAWFHHMQETQPVRYRPEYNMWEVFRYKDVQRVLLACKSRQSTHYERYWLPG
jgi:hypothetical protein